MAFTWIKNVGIRGVAAAVPQRKEFNKDFPKLSETQLAQYIKTVGVIERRCAIHDGSLCTSDLCYAAAEKLISELDWAKEEVCRKKKMDTSAARLFCWEEGLCVQQMHIGPYDNEPATIAQMEAFVRENGYQEDFCQNRFHHEIYLSDPRRTAPEKLKTIIRHPVR